MPLIVHIRTTLKEGLLYSMCWEDPEIFTSLVSEGDRVLTVASAADIALSCLHKNPDKVVAIDTNSDQLNLGRLKTACYEQLSYEDCQAMLGSFSVENDRAGELIQELELNPEVKTWVSKQGLFDEQSLLESGRFERYLRTFVDWLLPLAISSKTIEAFLAADSLADQRSIYNQRIDAWRYRVLFRFFFGRMVMRSFGRHPDLLKHVKDDLASVFYKRMEHAWCEVSIHENYFFRFILQGAFNRELALPIWAQPECYEQIRTRTSRLAFGEGSITSYLSKTQETFDAINLSDVSDALTKPEAEQLFDTCRNRIRSNGRLLVWNNMVDRKPVNGWRLDHNQTERLWNSRKVSFYGFLGVYNPE